MNVEQVNKRVYYQFLLYRLSEAFTLDQLSCWAYFYYLITFFTKASFKYFALSKQQAQIYFLCFSRVFFTLLQIKTVCTEPGPGIMTNGTAQMLPSLH